jgi:hypothetical protein
MGKAEDQCFHLKLGEHLWGQGRIFGQRIAKAGGTINQRAPRPERIDIAIKRALRNFELIGQGMRSDRLRQRPHQVQETEQAV